MITINNPLICNSLFSQARGLMFRKKRNLIMEFDQEKRVSLHMFFVFYPIDVFFLNQNKEVVEIKRDFKPFTIYTPKNKAKYILEMSELNQEIKIRDMITLKAAQNKQK